MVSILPLVVRDLWPTIKEMAILIKKPAFLCEIGQKIKSSFDRESM